MGGQGVHGAVVHEGIHGQRRHQHVVFQLGQHGVAVFGEQVLFVQHKADDDTAEQHQHGVEGSKKDTHDRTDLSFCFPTKYYSTLSGFCKPFL